MCSRSTCSDSNASSHILQLAKREKNRIKSDMENKFLTKKSQNELHESSCYTWGFNWAVSTLNVALQLERGHVLSVAVVAGCVAFPALAVLLFQLQVVFHMVHEPAAKNGNTQSTEMSTNSLACGSLWTISQLLTVIKNRLLTFIWTDDSGLSKDLETTQNRLLRKIGVPNWFANSWSQRCILSDCFGC